MDASGINSEKHPWPETLMHGQSGRVGLLNQKNIFGDVVHMTFIKN